MANRTELPPPDVVEAIIKHEHAAETLVTWAEKLGRGLVDNEGLTATQLRGFFGVVRQIQAEVIADMIKARTETALSVNVQRQLKLLKPKLAYQAARDQGSSKRDGPQTRKDGVLRLKEILEPAIDHIEDKPDRFRRFVEYFEAIVAYHKVAEEQAAELGRQQRFAHQPSGSGRR